MTKDFNLWDNAHKEIVNVKAKRAGKEWNCHCPFHDDKTPSMFINEEKEMYVCYSCKAKGKLHNPDYKSSNNKKFTIDKTWDYVDADKKLIFQVLKQFTPKDFRQRRPDGKGGWHSNLEGVKPIPYKLPDIISSKRNIIIVEGEKDADRLISLGMCATTNSGGASRKWSPELNPYFKDRHVAVIMDNDVLDKLSGFKPGERHAHEVAEALNKVTKSVRVISLPRLKKRQDVSDWLDADGSKEELINILKDAPEWKKADKPKEVKQKSKIQEPVADAIKDIPFKFLGYNYGCHHYLSKERLQVKQLTDEGHKKGNLMGLADLSWWAAAFPTSNGDVHWDSAQNWTLRRSAMAGTYDERKLRGCGAWYDEGRTVVHLGNKLYVDGTTMKIEDFKSKNIYEIANAANIDFKNPLNDKEAREFLEICKKLPWESKMSGYLLAGWAVSAIICGALDWRPHIWISGPHGVGKTYIIDEILGQLLDTISLKVISTTTEAGIRQGIRNNAFPVLFDEAENKKQFSQERMGKLIELMRQASSQTGSVILKGSPSGQVKEYRIRSSFCLASILAKIEDKADESRICVLHIKKIIPPEEGVKMFKAFGKIVDKTLTKPYLSGMRARIINLIPIIRPNIPSFSLYFSEQGGKRYGDQMGTLISCAHALHSSALISEPDARKWILERNWDEQAEGTERTEENDCLQAILQHSIRTDSNVNKLVIELLYIASDGDFPGDNDKTDAIDLLIRHGIKIDDNYIYISDSHLGIKAILSKTAWNAKWRDILRRLPDAVIKNCCRFGHLTQRAVAIPIELVFTDNSGHVMKVDEDNNELKDLPY